jgi:hypothetical protein
MAVTFGTGRTVYYQKKERRKEKTNPKPKGEKYSTCTCEGKTKANLSGKIIRPSRTELVRVSGSGTVLAPQAVAEIVVDWGEGEPLG